MKPRKSLRKGWMPNRLETKSYWGEMSPRWYSIRSSWMPITSVSNRLVLSRGSGETTVVSRVSM